MVNKNIKIIDYVLIAGTVFVLIGIVFQLNNSKGEPIALSPENGALLNDREILFEFENAHAILIDDNVEFSSPQKYDARNNFIINLKPWKYYWKLVGNGISEIRQFSIESEVSLQVKKSENKEGIFNVVNVGTESLEVEVFESGKLKENIVLDVYSEKEISGDGFIGGKNE